MSLNESNGKAGGLPMSLNRAKGNAVSCRRVFLCSVLTQDFIYIFFPFMFGIYPYTVVTEKQRIAMEEAGVNYVFMTIYEITYNCVNRLLKN